MTGRAHPSETAGAKGITSLGPAAFGALFAALLGANMPVIAHAKDVTLTYGVDLTTNYISKGTTQTEDRPAIQPYAELGYGLVYAGIWASNARFDGSDDIEVDLSLGLRPSIGDVGFDLGVARYYYRDDKTEYGEAYIRMDWAASDRVSLGLDYYREFFADTDWLYASAALSDLPWDLTLSGGLGSDLGSRDLSSDKNVWDIGLTKAVTENVALDLRGYGGNLDDEKLVFTLSLFY